MTPLTLRPRVDEVGEETCRYRGPSELFPSFVRDLMYRRASAQQVQPVFRHQVMTEKNERRSVPELATVGLGLGASLKDDKV